MFLLDTNILSVRSPLAAGERGALSAWLERNGEHLYLSAVTVMEISYGVARLARKGATRRSALLRAWLGDVLAFHRGRVLPVDPAAALRAGELLAKARGDGIEIGSEDALIAATAELHGMTVLTRNLRHFEPMGVSALDPLHHLPPDVQLPG